MKKDANENYAGTICLKSPEEARHKTTLLMLFIVSSGIGLEVAPSLVFNGYFILGDDLMKSE